MVATHNAHTLAHQLFREEWQRLDDGDQSLERSGEQPLDERPEPPVEAQPDPEPERQPDHTSELQSEQQGAARYAGLTFTSACPYWLLPELVQLLEEAPHRSVTDLEPVIRELIAEQRFIEDAGDPAIDPEHNTHAEVEAQVRLFVRVLERVRAHRRTGAWSDMPTTPQMFG